MALCSGEKLLAHAKWCNLVFRPSMSQLVESFDLKATAVSDIWDFFKYQNTQIVFNSGKIS